MVFGKWDNGHGPQTNKITNNNIIGHVWKPSLHGVCFLQLTKKKEKDLILTPQINTLQPSSSTGSEHGHQHR